jgi:hypothetical protein
MRNATIITGQGILVTSVFTELEATSDVPALDITEFSGTPDPSVLAIPLRPERIDPVYYCITRSEIGRTGISKRPAYGERLGKPQHFQYSHRTDSRFYESVIGRVGLASSGTYSDYSGQNRVVHRQIEGVISHEKVTSHATDDTFDPIRYLTVDGKSYEDHYRYDSESSPVEGQSDALYCTDLASTLSQIGISDSVSSWPASYVFHNDTISGNRYLVRGWLAAPFDVEIGGTSDWPTYSFEYWYQSSVHTKPSGSNDWFIRRWQTKAKVTIEPAVSDNVRGILNPSHSLYRLRYASLITDVHLDEHSPDNIYRPVVGIAVLGSLASRSVTVGVTEDVDDTEISSETHYKRVSGIKDRLRHVARDIDNNFVLFTGGVMPAVVDAWDKFDRVIESNIIEAISELGALRATLDPTSPILQIVETYTDKFRKVGRLMHLTGALSDVHLWFSFGFAPFRDVFAEFAANWDKIMKYRFQPEATLHGKATHTFKFHGMNVTMVTRTSIRYWIPPWSFVASLMPLRAVGLDPTLTNIWETRWMSFFADWLFGIKDRLAYYDAAMYLVLGKTKYYCHSYTLYIPFEDIPGVDGVGQYVHYRREVSKYFPAPPSESLSFHDWLGGTNVPIITAAAVLRKVILP